MPTVLILIHVYAKYNEKIRKETFILCHFFRALPAFPNALFGSVNTMASRERQRPELPSGR
jgi:hypothetical protein